MEEFYHFSHDDHPLTFFQDNDYENPKPNLCRICGLPILSTPSYTCTISACNFFLHKPCSELEELLKNHPSHDVRNHWLFLKQKLPGCGDSDRHGKPFQNFSYQCDECEFEIHPLVAVSEEIKVKLKGHPSHPLVAIPREILSSCDACGEEHKGFFFHCSQSWCNFLIHQDCTLLPSPVKLASHPHTFILTYSLPHDIRRRFSCIICQRSRLLAAHKGVYFCGECQSFAHVSCGKSNMEHLESETRRGLIQLPDDDKWDIFPSLAIRTYVESNPIPNDDHPDIKDRDKKLTIKKYHNHPLKLNDDGISSSGEACSLVCDVCIQPIHTSSPFYRCLESDKCSFLAHNICANLPSVVDLSFAGGAIRRQASLCPASSELSFNSIFLCYHCDHPCNGFCYYFDDVRNRIFVDVECMVAPNTIQHTSHGQHVLFRTMPSLRWPSDYSCCPRSLYDFYRCIICEFYIHIPCALLPKRTQHKFDEHPLELITDHYKKSSDGDQQEYCLCEVCEREIDQKYWFYGCGKCEQFFHINCIPPVGYFSKVKFGGSVVDNNIHPHPITLTRMLGAGRHEWCRYCHGIIEGFADGMAFHCSDCDFWIHFSCARNSATGKTGTKLMVYSEIADDFHQFWLRI